MQTALSEVVGSHLQNPTESRHSSECMAMAAGTPTITPSPRISKKWIQIGTSTITQNSMCQTTWTIFMGINMKYVP